jgi:hypothetical protein
MNVLRGALCFFYKIDLLPIKKKKITMNVRQPHDRRHELLTSSWGAVAAMKFCQPHS